MSNKHWVPVRGAQGIHSRQAHADLPEGTYEREMSKEGVVGPAAFLYHRNPPPGWVECEGPRRPRATRTASAHATAKDKGRVRGVLRTRPESGS